MTDFPIPDAAFQAAERAAYQCPCSGSQLGPCCVRAAVTAAAPHIAVDQIHHDADAVRGEADRLAASPHYQPAYAAGFRDAAEALEEAATEIDTMLAERSAR